MARHSVLKKVLHPGGGALVISSSLEIGLTSVQGWMLGVLLPVFLTG